jgi:hypothetical protein
MTFRKPNIVHPGQWVTFEKQPWLVIGRQGGAYRIQAQGSELTRIVNRSDFKRRSANARQGL